jgi:hypothetical protein
MGMVWGGGIIAVVVLLLMYFCRRDGRRLEQRDRMKGTLDEIQKANQIRDRLRRDAGYAERVRRRFTR